MSIPEVHGLGSRVLAQIPGSQPFEGHVWGYGGDGVDLAHNAEYYLVNADETLLRLIRALDPSQVRRIVRATIPGGDTIVGTVGAIIRDFDENITGYTVCYLHQPTIWQWVAPEWVQPL